MTIVAATSTIIERVSTSKLNTSYADAPDVRGHVIVMVQDDSGAVGLGEASPLPHFTGETVSSIDLILREQYLPKLIGRSPFDRNAIRAALESLPGNPSAKAAIDIALYDLQGRLTSRPVVDLLGGPVRETVSLNFPIGICPVDEAVGKAKQAVGRGIHTLKLKIGRDPDADVERIRAVRSEVGPDVRIRIDANAGYTATIVTRILNRLASVDLEYIEQPVAPWDIAGLAAVRRATGVPVMADESLHTLRDALALITHEAVDVFAIKLIKTGGLHQARAIAALAAAHRIDVVVISPFETQIGAAAGLALALTLPTDNRAHELRVFDSQPEYATTDIRAEHGMIIPSRTPGLGVETIRELEHVGAMQ